IEGLRQISDLEWQAVLLGTGDTLLESAMRQLEHEIPGRVRAILAFDSRLARRMYAGADILMMPSRYEPCGLAQMIAMRYGCIPVARATGGLKDTIIDDPDPNRSTGLLFNLPEIKDFTAALCRVLSVYSNRSLWHTIQTNAMRQDFSWQLSARAYANLYRKLIAGVNSATEIIE
ncbi:MAG: glycosyltransferase, partial [Anaerolineaceae bacterium]|nr:glycosyltransferase [Anaerolineaceae bacterium]